MTSIVKGLAVTIIVSVISVTTTTTTLQAHHRRLGTCNGVRSLCALGMQGLSDLMSDVWVWFLFILTLSDDYRRRLRSLCDMLC